MLQSGEKLHQDVFVEENVFALACSKLCSFPAHRFQQQEVIPGCCSPTPDGHQIHKAKSCCPLLTWMGWQSSSLSPAGGQAEELVGTFLPTKGWENPPHGTEPGELCAGEKQHFACLALAPCLHPANLYAVLVGTVIRGDGWVVSHCHAPICPPRVL